MKTVILAALAFAIACVVAGFIIMSRPATGDAALPATTATPGAIPAQTAEMTQISAPPDAPPPASPVAVAPAPPSPVPQSAPPAEPVRAAAKALSRPAQAKQGGPTAKEPRQDPLAREALALVGLDPTAEAYWHSAINDPALSAHERQDLIEDLNEDGLLDPKHPAPEDLPVILSRIRIIEAAGPYAMDQVNADAFQEAYKDLMNLAYAALGGGEPVR
jgi:hypothetical protein